MKAMTNNSTINRKIHVSAFGTSGRMLFTMDFEPYFPTKRYYAVMESLYQNEELTGLFGEEICSLSIQEEKASRNAIRGFYEGMTLAIYSENSNGKMVDIATAGDTAESVTIRRQKRLTLFQTA